MLNLAEAFAARGHRVDLVLCRPHGHFLADVPDTVRLIPLRSASRWRRLLRANWSEIRRTPSLIWPLIRFDKASYLPGLADYLRSHRPDALLAAATYPNLMAVWGRRVAGVNTRVILTEHNHLSSKVARASKRWKLPLVRHVYPHGDWIVATSNGVADDLSMTADIPRERISTIYNPVVNPRLLEKSRAPVDHPWFRGDGPPVVLSVGKLIERKDFATLLRAFRRVRAQRDARLVILGEGKQRDRLTRLAVELGIRDFVDLPGFSLNPFAYMARSAVFVLSSRWEGLGLVLIEALACGCPVVSTDCPSGPAEILDHGKYGALAPVGRDSELADAILSTLEKPPPRERGEERATMFDVEVASHRYLELLCG